MVKGGGDTGGKFQQEVSVRAFLEEAQESFRETTRFIRGRSESLDEKTI